MQKTSVSRSMSSSLPLLLREEEMNHSEEDDTSPIDETFEDEDFIDLFVDLGTMGLELDNDACKDLMEDEM